MGYDLINTAIGECWRFISTDAVPYRVERHHRDRVFLHDFYEQKDADYRDDHNGSFVWRIAVDQRLPVF